MVVEEGNPSSSMEHPLIGASSELGLIGKAELLIGEVKRQLYLAGPLIAVSVLQYSLQVISLMFVGHLGKLSLSGASMATSFASVTGFSLLRAMFVLLLVSIPLALILAYTESILVAFGQNQEIAFEAGRYARWMIPSLFAYVFKSGLGSKGAAAAITISYWVNLLLLALYVKFSPSCKSTWTGFSMEAFHDILDFLKLSIPSALMTCLEYWSFEMVVLLSGFLPNPKLETSVLSISSLNTMWLVYMIPVGLSSAASNEDEVVKYVAAMMPVLATSDFMDGIQCALSGAARGCGWQKMCSIINFGAYYVAGLPSAVLFAFVFHLGGKGLWMGIICALVVQLLMLMAVIISTNWEQEARKAQDRVYGFIIPGETA
ncbi:MATE efflux family protein 8 [Acorus calamus]|uniref:MATE efflux family protein 8 n=1 Tax=Acorus calamus TaxID=4465 RepID=A0AAV9DKI9_ACOCL|nr:MATE efflux family protein 8 [Acorus calamus]